MALALIKLNEVNRIIHLYEDVICLFYLSSPKNQLDNVITERIEDILGNAYQLTDSLIKLIKVDISDLRNVSNQKILSKIRINQDDCPAVCYFKNSKLIGKHTQTFTKHLLESWIKQFFYLSTS